MTIFQPIEEVQSWVEVNVLEPNGLPLQWQEKGPAGRWASIRDISVPLDGESASEGRRLVLQSPANSTVTYTLFDMPGKGCAHLGLDGLKGLLLDLDRTGWRWNGKRLDLKWDHVTFTPQLVDATNRAGQFVSRALSTADAEFHQDGVGKSTAYLGMRHAGKTKMLRVYDKHGFNRCEVELLDKEADDAMRALLAAPVAQWSSVSLGYLLRAVDYRDVAADRRNPDRCSRLSWWSSFVGQAAKVTKLALTLPSSPASRLPIGTSEMRVQMVARRLWPIVEAMGADYLAQRIRHHAAGKITQDDRDFAEKLKEFRYSGLAGLPGEAPEDGAGDGVPF